MSESPLPKRRGRPKTLDRARILAVATESYWDEGPASMGVNEVCRRAGISKPGLYREFGGEDGLTAAVLDHYWATVIRPSFQPLAAEHPFAEMLDGVLTWLTSERGVPAGCLFAKMRSAPVDLGPETAARIAVLRDEMRAVYQAWFERGLVQGEVNAAVEPGLAGYLLDTQFKTVQMLVAEGEPHDLVREQARLALACLLPSEQ
ncbi:MAG: TetR/AcrR family transcriptional regulator [Bacteroidota bacterium]